MKKFVCVLLAILGFSLVIGVKREIRKEFRDELNKIRVIGHDGKPNRILSEFFVEILGCFRNLFINGDENSGFPSLQEIDYGDFHVDENNDLYNLIADVTNAKVYGFGNFTVNKADLNLIGINFEYDLDFHVTTSGQYANGDLKMGDINVQGNGEANLEMVMNMLGYAKIFPQATENPGEWIIAIIDYYGFELVRPDFHITGIMNDEQASVEISAEISKMVEHYVGENAEANSAQSSPIIMQKLNELIQDPDSSLNNLINLALEHCPQSQFFMAILHSEAIKQGFIKKPL